MKITRVERLLLALAVCGTLAVGARAAQEVVYDGDYATATVTTEQKTITYTDANGVQQTYTYTTVTGSPTVEVDVSGLEYESPNDDGTSATTAYYYKWSDGTLVEADSAADADVTIWKNGTSTAHDCTDGDNTGTNYNVDKSGCRTGEVGGGAYHIKSGSSSGYGNITGNIFGCKGPNDTVTGPFYGAAISITATANNDHGTIGDITGNFIGNNLSGRSYESNGGAIASYAGGSYSSATVGNIEGSFIGNYVTTSDEEARAGAISNYAYGTGSSATIGNITGDFIGNYAKQTETSSGSNIAMGGAIDNAANGTYTSGGTATMGDITGNFVNNYTDSNRGYSHGGAISNRSSNTGTAIMGNIEGDFIGNYSVTGTTSTYTAFGGAIDNKAYGSGKAIIGDLTSNFIGNYVSSTYVAYGGAISSGANGSSGSVEIGTITGDFIGNYAEATGSSGDAYGGAIANEAGASGSKATIKGDLTSNFIGNYASSAGSTAYGGALYNSATTGSTATLGNITGDFISNYATGSKGYGGAIYNNADSTSSATIGEITSSFISNTATTGGGAIYNSGTIGSIVDEGGDVTSVDAITNSTFVANEAANGGAIYNTGTITSIKDSEFVGNVAVSEDGDVAGGAIYNSGEIDSITGSTFYGSYASTTGGDAAGGLLYNTGKIGTLELDSLAYYHVSASGDAKGGAIYNDGTIDTFDVGDIIGNYAKSTSGDAMGGAIYNDENGELTLTGNIVGNYATGTNAYGGAIYNAGTVNVDIENKDAVISGNTANGEANFLYATADSVTNFNLTDATLVVADGIQGETGYEVNVTGNGIDATTFYMFKSFEDSNFSIGGTTLNTVDGTATKYNVNEFSITDDFNMVADVDIANKQMDRFVADNNYGDLDGTLNVSGLNAASDSTEKNIAVYFAETNLMYSVKSTVTGFRSPINTYEAFYVQKDDDGIHYGNNVYDISQKDSSLVFNASDENGGYFVINRTGLNPAIMVTPMSLMGALNAMNMSFGYSFEHSDYFMKLPSATRLAITENAKAGKAKKAPKETDATKPEYYNQNEMTMRGAWVKTYASNDNVSYKHGWESRDKMYGAIVGFDSNLRENGNGWASVFSGYVGTLGIRQEYEGGHIKQHGGLVGLTESFYKKNFYNAWILAAGRLKSHEHTENGHDSTGNDTWGIATKFGWNIELAGGKYTLLPTFAASYTTVSLDNYTNGADVYMSGSGVRAVQLNPNVKFIMNMEDGLQPYLTVGEIWTVGNSSSVKANGQKLDELELKPYTEYGIGVQKRWANERDAYVQLLSHSGGTDGFVFNAGVRWNF